MFSSLPLAAELRYSVGLPSTDRGEALSSMFRLFDMASMLRLFGSEDLKVARDCLKMSLWIFVDS